LRSIAGRRRLPPPGGVEFDVKNRVRGDSIFASLDFPL
jgi:hypothetical protein